LAITIGGYLAKPFNFFVSPVTDPMFALDRTFLCQSSAMEMLSREGMDFNHLLRHGIRYLSRDEEKEIRSTELDRVEGVREMILVDKGGEEFLSTVRSPHRNPIGAILTVVGRRSGSGWMILLWTSTISAISL
jgi:hypothetical protein